MAIVLCLMYKPRTFKSEGFRRPEFIPQSPTTSSPETWQKNLYLNEFDLEPLPFPSQTLKRMQPRENVNSESHYGPTLKNQVINIQTDLPNDYDWVKIPRESFRPFTYGPGSGGAGLRMSTGYEESPLLNEPLDAPVPRNPGIIAKTIKVNLPLFRKMLYYQVDLFSALMYPQNRDMALGEDYLIKNKGIPIGDKMIPKDHMVYGFGKIRIRNGKHVILSVNTYNLIDMDIPNDITLPIKKGHIFPLKPLEHCKLLLSIEKAENIGNEENDPTVEIEVKYIPISPKDEKGANIYRSRQFTSAQFIYDGHMYHINSGTISRLDTY